MFRAVYTQHCKHCRRVIIFGDNTALELSAAFSVTATTVKLFSFFSEHITVHSKEKTVFDARAAIKNLFFT